MNNITTKLTTISLILIVILSSLIIAIQFNPEVKSEEKVEKNKRQVFNNSSKGKRWDVKGMTFILIKGTFYEMGYQQGILLKDEITTNRRALTNFFENEGVFRKDLIELWNKQKDFVPEKIIDFIQGMADALNLTFEDLAISWVTEGVFYSKCCSISTWGKATKDGKLLHIRSMEFPLNIQDPETGTYVQENPVIVIAKPDNGFSFMYPTFAGYVIEDGINEKGIAVANIWSSNHDHNDYGEPMGIRLFEILYSAETAEEAIDILTTHKTYGYNFIVSDAKKPIGYAVETTASQTYYGTWDNPSESHRPFWEIEDTVRRANCFLNYDTSSKQRDQYNLRTFNNVFIEKMKGERWFYIWHQFKALSKIVDKNWGELDVHTGMISLRNMYQGESYNPMWNFIMKKIFEEVWWHWSACPETGEIMISFADEKNSGQYSQIIGFNYMEIIEKEELGRIDLIQS